MLKTPIFRKFRTSEHIQFFNNVVALCNKQDSTVLNIKQQVDKLEGTCNKLDENYKRSRGSSITKELTALDNHRDNALKCLSKMCDGLSYHFNPEIQQAADTIQRAMDKYGDKIYSMNYQAETSVVDNLVSDFENDTDLSSALEMVNLQDVVNELKTRNEQFNSRYLARVSETAGDDSISTTELITAASEDYRALADFINAYATVSPSAALSTLISQLNELTEQFNFTVERRSNTPAENEEPEADEALEG